MKARQFLVIASILVGACGEQQPVREIPAGPMPDTFRVVFETTKGQFVIEAYKQWAPVGTKRFYELATTGAFDDNAFYRVVPNFVAQWGTPGVPALAAKLDSVKLADDPRVAKNERGTVAYAHEGPGTRSHTFFINRRNSEYLDGQNFVPFGRVVEGMAVVDSLQWPYMDKADHHMIATVGNRYMKRNFPKADYIVRATVPPPASRLPPP